MKYFLIICFLFLGGCSWDGDINPSDKLLDILKDQVIYQKNIKTVDFEHVIFKNDLYILNNKEGYLYKLYKDSNGYNRLSKIEF